MLTPQPRLRTGFFSVLESHMLTPSAINEACTSVGVAKYGRSIGLDEKIKVDLIVIGSVAVDPKTGARLGKGEVITNYSLLYNLALLLLERVKNVRLKQDSRIVILQIMHTSCMVGMEIPSSQSLTSLCHVL